MKKLKLDIAEEVTGRPFAPDIFPLHLNLKNATKKELKRSTGGMASSGWYSSRALPVAASIVIVTSMWNDCRQVRNAALGPPTNRLLAVAGQGGVVGDGCCLGVTAATIKKANPDLVIPAPAF